VSRGACRYSEEPCEPPNYESHWQAALRRSLLDGPPSTKVRSSGLSKVHSPPAVQWIPHPSAEPHPLTACTAAAWKARSQIHRRAFCRCDTPARQAEQRCRLCVQDPRLRLLAAREGANAALRSRAAPAHQPQLKRSARQPELQPAAARPAVRLPSATPAPSLDPKC